MFIIKIINVYNISGLFFGCSSLKYLPDISIWNTSNIKDISLLFYRCLSLISLNDISKWNINKVNSLLGLFYGCSSLEFLPDISKLNINNSLKLDNSVDKYLLLKNIFEVPIDIKKIFKNNMIYHLSYLFTDLLNVIIKKMT